MDYCIVMSVGYSVGAFVLWNLMALALGVQYPITTVFSVIMMSPIITFAVFIIGAIINCTFERVGTLFSLSPSISITLGWLLLGLGMAILPLLSNPPSPNLESLVLAGYDLASKSLSQSFLSSNIFYTVGNITLNVLGIR